MNEAGKDQEQVVFLRLGASSPVSEAVGCSILGSSLTCWCPMRLIWLILVMHSGRFWLK